MSETKTLIAIDPGLRACGVAWFAGDALVKAALVLNTEKEKRGPEAWRSMAACVGRALLYTADTLVLEIPQVYRLRFSGGDPADLLELAGVDGAVVGVMYERAGKLVGYLPRQWKGQTPKPVHNQRVMAALSTEERETVEPCAKHLVHNVVDAIGLGLFHLGRIKV